MAECAEVYFFGYQSRLRLASFDGIDPSTLTSLQLNNRPDLESLLESLLYSSLNLKSLTIDRPKSLSASGRDKLEGLLTSYRVLKKVAFSNRGQGRQYMQTMSAQRTTLKEIYEKGTFSGGGKGRQDPQSMSQPVSLLSERHGSLTALPSLRR